MSSIRELALAKAIGGSGGGGGDGGFLYGLDAPTSAIGVDGDIYLQYNECPYKIAYIVNTTTQVMSVHSKSFTKLTDDLALAMEVKSTTGYYGPVVISPISGGAKHIQNTTETPVTLGGETWYFAGGQYWTPKEDAPTIPTEYDAGIGQPSAQNAQDWADLVYERAFIGNGHPVFAAYIKIDNQWESLKGADITRFIE